MRTQIMLLKSEHIFLNSYSEVRQLCAPLRKLNLTHFSYTKCYEDGQRIYLTTDPDILDDYFKHEYYSLGNCEYDPKSYREQVLLWSTLPKQFIYELSRQKGLLDGIFMIKPGKGYTEFFNFASKVVPQNAINIYLTYLDTLKKFITYFKIQANTLIKKSERINFYLPYQKQNFDFMHTEIREIEFANFQPLGLTKRQYDCAENLLMGHSVKEIARLLQLSPRTVESYINNLKHKFSVNSKTELILHLAKLI